MPNDGTPSYFFQIPLLGKGTKARYGEAGLTLKKMKDKSRFCLLGKVLAHCKCRYSGRADCKFARAALEDLDNLEVLVVLEGLEILEVLEGLEGLGA